MKILQILPELNVGGVERGTLDLAKYFIEHGHESIVVSNGGTLVASLEAAGSRHYALAVHRKNLFIAWRCVKELRHIIRTEKVDIVHARSRVPAWIAYFATRKTDAEFVTTCHGYYSRNFASRIMGWGKLVIVISEVVGRHMIEHFGVNAHNIRLIPRSVDLDKFKFRKRHTGRASVVVSIIGRITPLKGHAFFLQAMAKVIRLMPFVRVRIIGDAPALKSDYKDGLILLTRRLGIADQVEFMGNRSDIPQLLSDSDVVVLSTVTQEAFGRVLIEAQAVGVPVVATKVGGVVNIIEHEKTGLLVLPKDPDGMANAVMRLINEPKLADTMVLEARRLVEDKYTIEQMASKTLAVYDEVKRLTNILVIKLGAAGDVILSTAAFKALRDRFPDAKIVCLTARENAAILHGCPYLDDVITYDHKDKDKGVPGFWRILQILRKYRFDKVIDLQNNTRSHLLTFLCAPRSSYGYKNSKWGMLLTDGILDDKPLMPPVEHQFRILKSLGIEYTAGLRLQMWPRRDDYSYALDLLHSEWIDEKTHTVVGINIAASERWVSKNWPVTAIADLCDRLAADGIRVVITGMEKDREFIRELMIKAKSKPAMLAGKTNLLQLAAVIAHCKVFVTPDSAPLHIASAMDVPVVALFGPTSPERHLPPGNDIKVMTREMECRPCYLPKCRSGVHACLKDITPYEVYLEIKKLLNKKGSAA
ncbi:MAG: lipopolysaccharide heptosyltransferase II [Candidatus Omnitrophica bacterium]|nr:lipopolysaccharide heptosyltransferase II [Candidatus Omnitrophota bacterium]